MEIRLKANAKINLTLDIVGIREDGFHYVDMIMQTVNLADKLTININKTGVISVTSSEKSLNGEENIAYKAAKLFFKKINSDRGTDIYIEKHIPQAAGLGGGSSDAAAVLSALNTAFGNPLSLNELEKLAVKLGADVPYFLHGGTVSVTGIGDEFDPLSDIPECFIVIAKNAQKRSTGEMYRMIDDIDNLDRPDNRKARAAVKSGDYKLLCSNIKNVFSAAWDSGCISEIMNSCNADAVSLSGSGPSFFGIFADESDAEKCYEMLKSNNIEAYITTPVKNPLIFE